MCDIFFLKFKKGIDRCVCGAYTVYRHDTQSRKGV
ncbi:MAG: hypothetical protein K0R15_2507 [Clostridiales bacterium]|nr:hypothetical protein [Clostridiales bacterium]